MGATWTIRFQHFGTTWRILVPFWTPSDFEEGPQIDNFWKQSQTNQKKKVQKTALKQHDFLIDLSLNFGWILVSCLLFFHSFTIRTCNLLSHQKPLFFQWISMILLFRETWFWWFSWSFPLPVLAFSFSGKRTPKWIQTKTKMGPQITPKQYFWDFWAFWKKVFFQGFWKQKKSAPNPEKSGKKPARGDQDL